MFWQLVVLARPPIVLGVLDQRADDGAGVDGCGKQPTHRQISSMIVAPSYLVDVYTGGRRVPGR